MEIAIGIGVFALIIAVGYTVVWLIAITDKMN